MIHKTAGKFKTPILLERAVTRSVMTITECSKDLRGLLSSFFTDTFNNPEQKNLTQKREKSGDPTDFEETAESMRTLG